VNETDDKSTLAELRANVDRRRLRARGDPARRVVLDGVDVMNRCSNLTLGQRAQITAAATLLVTPSTRDHFLRDVEIALAMCSNQPPDDGDVDTVVRQLLDNNVHSNLDAALRRFN